MQGMRYQPQGPARISSAHPLAQGLVAAVLPSTTPPCNLVTDAKLLPVGNVLQTAGPHGLQLTADGANAGLTLDISSNVEFTFLAIAKPADLGAFRALMGIGTQNGGLVLNGSDWSLSNGLAHSNTLPARSDRYQVVAVKRDSNGLRYVAVDGRITAGSPDATTRLAGPVNLLCRINQNDATFKGDVALLLGWSRSLSNEEIREVSRNPWQLFASNIDEEDLDFVQQVQAQLRKALYLNGQGYISESPTIPAKPLVLLNGQLRERASSEGAIVIVDQGRLRVLRSDETI